MCFNKNYNTLWNIKLSYSACDRQCFIFVCFIYITNLSSSKIYSVILFNDTSIHKATTKTCAHLHTQETEPSCPVQLYMYMCHP